MNKTIVVTGGKGFLGQSVCRQLTVRDYKVIPLNSKDYDLRIVNSVADMYYDLKPDIVIHLAAKVGGIGANQLYPGTFFYDNMSMGLHLIEEGRKFGLEKFVQVGTVCSYPKFTGTPFREEQFWNGYPEETNAAYGIAKKALLTMLQAYRKEYSFNGIYLLPVNLYGPNDNFDPEWSHVIPAMISKFYQAKQEGAHEVHLWGTGRASREFLYVDDCAEAITLATEKYNKPEPINIGSGQEITIERLALVIAEIIGFQGEIIFDKSKPDGQPVRCLSIIKAVREFGFVPRTDLYTGLMDTISWYRNKKHVNAAEPIATPA